MRSQTFPPGCGPSPQWDYPEKIEPLLSHGAMEGGQYVCFNKARVSLALVDAFSRALREFKQTEKFQAIHHKYFP